MPKTTRIGFAARKISGKSPTEFTKTQWAKWLLKMRAPKKKRVPSKSNKK